MIIEIIALTVSVVVLIAQVLTMREQNKKWDEYFENQKKRKETVQHEEIIIENKIKGSILLKSKHDIQ
jgi:cytidylate kinase